MEKNKILKNMLKTIGIILCVLLILFASLVIYVTCSPQPAVWLLRNQFGDSAGAHIAAQAVLLATNSEYEEKLGLSSSITNEQLKGAVLYCGPYDVSKMLDTGNKMIDFFSSRIGWALLGEKDWKSGDMIKTTTIKDYITEELPPIFITDRNTGSFESQGKELAEELQNIGIEVQTLFFEKEKYGEVGHEYQFSIGDNGPGSLCYEKTISFLRKLK